MPSSPASPLDPRELKRLSELARLDRGGDSRDAEGRALARGLRTILDYVGRLGSLPSGETPAPAPVSGPDPRLRPDEPRPSLDRERVLSSAPERLGDLFGVKRVVG